MHHWIMPKKLLIFLSSLYLAGCASQSCDRVICHQWTQDEKFAHYKADKALSADSSLHPLIRDYERICVALG